jgi:hypothetical protein
VSEVIRDPEIRGDIQSLRYDECKSHPQHRGGFFGLFDVTAGHSTPEPL